MVHISRYLVSTTAFDASAVVTVGLVDECAMGGGVAEEAGLAEAGPGAAELPLVRC